MRAFRGASPFTIATNCLAVVGLVTVLFAPVYALGVVVGMQVEARARRRNGGA